MEGAVKKTTGSKEGKELRGEKLLHTGGHLSEKVTSEQDMKEVIREQVDLGKIGLRLAPAVSGLRHEYHGLFWGWQRRSKAGGR